MLPRPPPDATSADVPWLSDAEQRAWRSLLAAQARLSKVLDAELQAAEGTTLADHEVLIVLSEQPDGAVRMADLAEVLTLSRSGLTRRVDRLAEAGLVIREQCPTDRRGVLARLTDAGRLQLARAAPTHVRGVRRHFIDAMEPAELASLAATLDRVAAEVQMPTACPGIGSVHTV